MFSTIFGGPFDRNNRLRGSIQRRYRSIRNVLRKHTMRHMPSGAEGYAQEIFDVSDKRPISLQE